MIHLKLTSDERDFILKNISSELSEELYTKLTAYIPKNGYLHRDEFVLREIHLTDEKTPLEYKITVNQIDYVSDLTETHYSCFIRNNYYEISKEKVFDMRWKANLAGHQTHLKLLIDDMNYRGDAQKEYEIQCNYPRYEDMIKKVKRKIYLILKKEGLVNE